MSQKKAFDIDGMHCEKCVAHVKEALEGIAGVHAARVNLESNSAVVKLDADVADAVIVKAVEDAGFKAVPQGAGGFAR